MLYSEFKYSSQIFKPILIISARHTYKNIFYVKLLTKAFGVYSTLVSWINYPIVVLQCVHCLQDCWHPAHRAIDLCVWEELCGQVGIQSHLNCHRGINPQGWVEEDVVQKLKDMGGLHNHFIQFINKEYIE